MLEVLTDNNLYSLGQMMPYWPFQRNFYHKLNLTTRNGIFASKCVNIFIRQHKTYQTNTLQDCVDIIMSHRRHI